jgi:hypothetical protein
MTCLRLRALLLALATLPVQAQIQLGPSVPRPPEKVEAARLVTSAGGRLAATPDTVPRFSPDKKVVAIASAVGGEISHVIAKITTGSNLDPYQRQRATLSDSALDAVIMRGVDRVVARTMPDTERIFLRLNPLALAGMRPEQRDTAAFERLLAEMRKWPQRQQWDRIVIMTPRYMHGERAGLGAKLHGIGVYVQNLDNLTEYEVIEPDGSKGEQRRNRYVALYYYATLTILDAKTLQIIEQRPWFMDEKIHDSSSAALHMVNMLSADQIASRLEAFAEEASGRALASTLSGRVEPGELQVLPSMPPQR